MHHRSTTVEFVSEEEAQQALSWIRFLAKNPSVEPERSHRLCVVVNPHGGRGRAVKVWQQTMCPLLEGAGLVCDVIETQYAGHAMDVGRGYDPEIYEGVVLFGGDGTTQGMYFAFNAGTGQRDCLHIGGN